MLEVGGDPRSLSIRLLGAGSDFLNSSSSSESSSRNPPAIRGLRDAVDVVASLLVIGGEELGGYATGEEIIDGIFSLANGEDHIFTVEYFVVRFLKGVSIN